MAKLLATLVLFMGSPVASQEKAGFSEAIDASVQGIPGYKPQNVGAVLEDADFLKRLTRDLTGADPTAKEVQEFVASKDPNKRELKIIQLTESAPFAEFWAKRLAEVFFDGSGTVVVEADPGLVSEVRTPLVKNFVTWLQSEIAKDRPYNEIVWDMLDARGPASGNPAVAYKLSFQQGPEPAVRFAIGMSRHLMGLRLQCARCHDHPYDAWTVENLYSLAAFNVRARPRGVGARDKNQYDDVDLKYADDGELSIPAGAPAARKSMMVKMADAGTAKPIFPFGGEARPFDDRIKVLANLMRDRHGHRQAARTLANRVWGWLLGRGVIHPVDDFNKRTMAEARMPLLELLTSGLIDNKFSVRFLVRTICTTKIYQRAEVASVAEGTEVYWRGAWVRIVQKRKPRPLASGLISFDLPSAWLRDIPTHDCKAQYSVPDKEKKARDAELSLFQGSQAQQQIDSWSRQMAGLTSKSTAVEGGKGKITLHEFSGEFTCYRNADGAGNDRMLVGRVEIGGETWLFRLLGPVPTVDGSREEFLTLLKSATK